MTSLCLHLLILLFSCAVRHTLSLKCIQGGETGDLENHQPVPITPPVNKECADPNEVCQIMAGADGQTGAKAIYHSCIAKPADMNCQRPLSSDEGKTGNIGPAFCAKDGCNTIAFLKKSCGGGDDGGGGGNRIHYTHALSYSALFMAYAACRMQSL